MSNQLKEQYNEQLQAAMENNEFARGRKIATVCVVAMALPRMLLFIADAVIAIRFELPFAVFAAIPLLMTLLFAVGIRGGVRALTILITLGGFASLWMEWQNESLAFVLTNADILLAARGGVYIIAVITSIIPMVYLFFNPAYKRYAEEITRIKKDVFGMKVKR